MSADSCVAAEGKKPYSPDEALRLILADIAPLPHWDRLSPKQALGRVLFQDVVADVHLPSYTQAAMDGYALRAADLTESGGRLELIGTSWAGRPYLGALAAGQCVRIFTGAMMPDGADSVVMQEDACVEAGTVCVPSPVKPGRHVRRAGEELCAGSTALTAGKRLTPADLALLAALGQNEVQVYAKPRVAFFSCGDELCELGHRLLPGRIYDSNRYALDGLLRELGIEGIDLGIVADDPSALRTALSYAAQVADMVITTGGASVGEADFIPALLAELGQMRLWKMAIKPGKPIVFGRIDNAWFFGLPGNPVAVSIGFRLAVAPALTKLSGSAPKAPLRMLARARWAIEKSPGRVEFQRGSLHQDEAGQWWVSAFARQGSHLLTGMSQADCLIVLPADCRGVAEGEPVTVEPLTDTW